MRDSGLQLWVENESASEAMLKVRIVILYYDYIVYNNILQLYFNVFVKYRTLRFINGI